MKPLITALISIITFSFVLAIAAMVSPDDAAAIPAFARKYRASCSMCHVATPKLKAYGEAFAGNGFVLPDGEEPKRSTIDTGDSELFLMRDFPFAVRLDAYVRAGDTETADADFETPYGLKFLSGGRVSNHVSYYFYFYAFERGEVAGLEDAYLHFNNLGGVDFDIMAGQFQVSDPLFKRELRLTFEDYWIYTLRVGDSRANLTYDRGLMLTYGSDVGLDLIGQVVNGNGIPPAENRIFDFDTEKAFSLRASQGVGPVRLGLFGYFNREENEAGTENELWYAGGDATVGGEKWEVNAQVLRREDDNPLFVAQPDKVTTDGAFVELVVMPQGDRSRWIGVVLYNWISGDLEAHDLERITLGVNHMAARNLRFLFEVTQDIEAEETAFTVGAMTAF
jgi:hypothetical protein